MARKLFSELNAEHTGKVSDKWSLYLQEYNRIFSEYKKNPIRILEIGVQNGGSLEILAKYFANAQIIIGSDINEDCHRLNYKDDRIRIVVGDIKAPKTREQILKLSPRFDIIIDDGSHVSSDIINTFLLYFPHLVEGGVFVIEDLHCSYWSTFEGGLFDPKSSIAFFKFLIDLINHEHWNVPTQRNLLLQTLLKKYDCNVSVETLFQIHSIEFINSMCVVRKSPQVSNGLGYRAVVGSSELVTKGHLNLDGKPYKSDLVFDVPYSSWDLRDTPLEERLLESEQNLAHANQSLLESEQNLAHANQLIKAYQESISWKITRPFRFVGSFISRVEFLCRLIFLTLKNYNEVYAIFIKIKKKGFRFLFNKAEALQSKEYSRQIMLNRGMSPEFLGAVLFLSAKIIEFRQWIDRDASRKKYLKRALSIARGEIWEIKKNLNPNLKFYIDSPNKLFKVVHGDFFVSGWSVNLNLCTAGNVRVKVGNVQYSLVRVDREDVKILFKPNYQLKGELGFKTALPLSFGLNVSHIEIQDIDGIWKTIRRSFLLRVPRYLFIGNSDLHSYNAFQVQEKKDLKRELIELRRHIDIMIYRPIFTVIIDVRLGDLGFDDSLKSVFQQIYSQYEIYVLSNKGVTKLLPNGNMGELSKISLSKLPGDFIIFLSSGQKLASVALYEFANILNQDSELDLIYGDEDFISKTGKRFNPFWKPDWSPDYLEAFNYIGFPSCFRLALLSNCLEPINLYDLILRFTELTSKVRHIPKILGHNELHFYEKYFLTPEMSASNCAALQGRLERTGRVGIVSEHKFHKGCYEIYLNMRSEPLISIIVPTAGKIIEIGERRIDLVVNLVNQIRSSNYKNIEIIIIDNGDLASNQIQDLKNNNCQLISYKEPIFNISKKLNLGASVAKGHLLLLMNDDIEVISLDWISRMAEHFEKPHVGVVGAKLLYPNEKIQHVGIVHNYGNPDHVRRLYPKEDAGYFFSTCGVHNYMAVTGAVMMTLRDIYWQVGGYSEELAVSFNDVDFCNKIRELNLTVVYAPQAELIHMESLSCARSEANNKELSWFSSRWAHKLIYDPFYNEQFLTTARPTFEPLINKRLL